MASALDLLALVIAWIKTGLVGVIMLIGTIGLCVVTTVSLSYPN